MFDYAIYEKLDKAETLEDMKEIVQEILLTMEGMRLEQITSRQQKKDILTMIYSIARDFTNNIQAIMNER